MGSKQERKIMWGMVPYRLTGGVHSENQRARKRARDRRPRGFGEMDRLFKAKLRRDRIERSQSEFEEEQEALEDQREGLRFLEERRQFQLHRALEQVCKETATPEDMDYISRKGKVSERYTIPEGQENPEEWPELIVTDVYLTPSNSKNSS